MKVVKSKEFQDAYQALDSFTKIPRDYGLELSGNAFKLLHVLLHSGNGFYYKKVGLARKLHISRQYIAKFLSELEEAGYITQDEETVSLVPYEVATAEKKENKKPEHKKGYASSIKEAPKKSQTSYSLEELLAL